jgi:hypothetical protein
MGVLEWLKSIFVETTVPLWVPIAVLVLAAIVSAAITRKFGANWLALLGFVLTPADIKLLAVLLWRTSIIPATVKSIRFKDSEEEFANYVVKKVLELLPEIGKLDVEAAKVIEEKRAYLGPVSRSAFNVNDAIGMIRLQGRGSVLIGPPLPDKKGPGDPVVYETDVRGLASADTV